MTCCIALVESTHPLDESLHPPFLKDSHQRWCQSLPSIWGHLGYGSSGSVPLLNIAPSHMFELQVSRNICWDQYICQLTTWHKQLWNKVNVPVVDAAVLLPRLLPLAVVAILLEELDYVKIILFESAEYWLFQCWLKLPHYSLSIP